MRSSPKKQLLIGIGCAQRGASIADRIDRHEIEETDTRSSHREARFMTEFSQLNSRPPFPPNHRSSGVLLHVTSLPTPYGVGDVGPMAIRWIDLLAQAGQSWWQALPLGPTGYGNSPYQPLSSFAGNALLLSPDWLVEDGLLRSFGLPGVVALG